MYTIDITFNDSSYLGHRNKYTNMTFSSASLLFIHSYEICISLFMWEKILSRANQIIKIIYFAMWKLPLIKRHIV